MRRSDRVTRAKAQHELDLRRQDRGALATSRKESPDTRQSDKAYGDGDCDIVKMLPMTMATILTIMIVVDNADNMAHVTSLTKII